MYGQESGRDPRNGSGADAETPGPSRQPPPVGPSPARFPAPELRTRRHSARVAPPRAARAQLPAPRPPGHRHGRRPETGGHGRLLIGGLAVVLLLAVSAVATTVLLSRGTTRGGDPTAPPVTEARPSPTPARSPLAGPLTDPITVALASRDTDPSPLTVAEVFGAPSVDADSGAAGYEVLRSQQRRDCTVAASGEIGDLLERFGCSQVVRATLRSPDGERLATAGLFNLTDRAGAIRADERITALLGQGRGRFPGLPAGERTEALTAAESQVSWQAAGHYLVYCVVVRADGRAAAVDDPQVREVLIDLLDRHLRQEVLGARAAQAGPAPSGTG